MKKLFIVLNKGNIFWINLIILNILLLIGGIIYVSRLSNNFNNLRLFDYIDYKITYSQEKENLLYSFNIEQKDYRLLYYQNTISKKETGTLIKQNTVFSHSLNTYVVTPEEEKSYIYFTVNDLSRYKFFYRYDIVDNKLILYDGGVYNIYLQVQSGK